MVLNVGVTGQETIAAIIERWKVERGETNTTIAQALAEHGIETTQSTVSLWLRDKQPLTPDEVFALERVLELEPGELSAHLGYVPADAVPGVLQALAVDDAVTEDMRHVLRTIYTDHVGRRRRRNRR